MATALGLTMRTHCTVGDKLVSFAELAGAAVVVVAGFEILAILSCRDFHASIQACTLSSTTSVEGISKLLRGCFGSTPAASVRLGPKPIPATPGRCPNSTS